MASAAGKTYICKVIIILHTLHKYVNLRQTTAAHET